MKTNDPGGRARHHVAVHSLAWLAVSSLILSSCAPAAAWPTPAPGGPKAPIGAGQPLPIPPQEVAALTGGGGAALPTVTPPPAADEQFPQATPTQAATSTRTPTPTPTPTPAPPAEPLTTDAAQECLAAGNVLYGLALQNTNVRQAADGASCRVGRIPKGSLVRVTGYHAIAAGAVAAASTAMAAPRPLPEGIGTPVAQTSDESSVSQAPRVGYLEDIQPIFVRTCNTCHSAIVRNKELQVTTFAGVMKGSTSGPVVIPGDAANSILWQQIDTGRMPMVGALSEGDKALIKVWIESGAPRQRPPAPMPAPMPAELTGEPSAPAESDAPSSAANYSSSDLSRTWLVVDRGDYNSVADPCANPAERPLNVVSSELILPVACKTAPAAPSLDSLRVQLNLPIAIQPANGAPSAAPVVAAPLVAAASAASADASLSSGDETAAVDAEAATVTAAGAAESPAAAPSSAAFAPGRAADAGIQVGALGLPAPTDGDGWLTPRGGLCVESKLPNNPRGITALTFAPDGRLFLALDSNLASDVDPLILYDAHHPSRSIAVVDSSTMQGITEILVESTRVTGLDWDGGNLFVSRAGEVGVIPDGGEYDTLASGFAVTSNLFHANNGIVVSGGWLYESAGGVIDGYSDGPLVGMDEVSAQQIASGGNPYSARIVRAPVSQLLGERSIGVFSTAARGARNPYGIAVDPTGRIWFTDNGATNVPDGVSAGDEVNVLNPASAGSSDADAPYYGFPLALTEPKEWYTRPAVVLPNTAAPTGVAWALGTIFFAQYGKDPGLYRIGSDAAGNMIAERVLLGWPILSLATAPDGALWIGMGDGGLYRITTGC